MHARDTRGCRPDTRAMHERMDHMAESVEAVAVLRIAAEQRLVVRRARNERLPDAQIRAQLARGAHRYRYPPGLVELALVDAQHAGRGVDILQTQPGDLAAAQPGGVHQYDREAMGRRPQGI